MSLPLLLKTLQVSAEALQQLKAGHTQLSSSTNSALADIRQQQQALQQQLKQQQQQLAALQIQQHSRQQQQAFAGRVDSSNSSYENGNGSSGGSSSDGGSSGLGVPIPDPWVKAADRPRGESQQCIGAASNGVASSK